MRPSRPTDLTPRSTADALELPTWEQEQRTGARRSQDRVKSWIINNLFGLLAVGGAVLTVLGLRMEGAPQDLARFKAQTTTDQAAIAGRVVKLEDVTGQLRDDNHDFRSALKEQHYLLCYIIGKQDPAAVGAIESCSARRTP